MNFLRILWDDPDDQSGNVQHIAEHGLDVEDVEGVLADPTSEGVSESTGLPCVWGYTSRTCTSSWYSSRWMKTQFVS